MAGILKKLFGSWGSNEIPTKPLAEEISNNATLPSNGQVETPQLIAGCAQSVGMQRDHNEDALFSLTTLLSSDNTLLPFGLYIIADGMGGHQHGEVASNLAMRAMVNQVITKLYQPLFSPKSRSPQKSIQEIMRDGIYEAQQAIIQDAPGGGTTLTVALILGEQLTIAHVGDSRAYTISKKGKMEAITRDHSLVKRLVELGQITKDEAAVHPQRNVLYRALGQGDPLDADVGTFQLPQGGFLLVCSDGLWGVISEEKILNVIQNATSPEEASQKLVDAANEAGGPDNIAVILVRIPELQTTQ